MLVSVRACESCGSPRLRRARTRTLGQRLLRKVARLERYACGTCGHRGWRLPRVRTLYPDQNALGLASRPVESRDLRVDAAARRLVARGVLVAIVLGTVVALLLVRGE